MNRFHLVLLFVVASVAHARLGETEKQLIERFGQPTSRALHTVFSQGKSWLLGPSLGFQQGDWRISCDLVDGRVVRIDYTKRGEWTDEQIRLVLNTNTQGLRWTETTKGSAKLARTWTRGDGATARWALSGIHLVVPAYERARAVVEAKAKAEVSAKPKI